MLADTPRMQAYVAAMRRAVKPGSSVLDLGCGPGVFALLACQLGARRVYAVEPDNVIQLARDAAHANGFANRIEFFQSMSTEITLPEPADVIVSDLRGVLPWYRNHIESIIDARTRLLAADGVLVPRRDVLWAAIVEAPDRYQEIAGVWQEQGFDLSAAARVAVNNWRKTRIEPHELITKPVCWSTLDYVGIDSASVRAEISWHVERAGTAHGIAVWFDSMLIDDIGFSNAPGAPELIYGTGLFPFSRAVSVAEGDRIDVRLIADSMRGDYVWRWESDFPNVSFKQSTFFGVPLSPAQLRKRSSSYTPVVNDDGAIAQFVLSRMDGTKSIEQIAAELTAQFPSMRKDALDLVSEISEKYSR